jgi:radical SAM protein with 4Fe4S-binding SPASM domain
MEINRDVPGPFAIQMEPVEGCSLACSFCGIQSIRANGADAEMHIHGKNSAPYRFMSMDTVERVAEEAARLKWNPRFEFAMHGEPTMSGSLDHQIQAVRKHHPHGYILLTSNGSGLLKDTRERIAWLFTCGLNTLALDDYKHSGGWVTQIVIELDKPWAKAHDIQPLRYPQQREGNPHQRHHKRKLVIINDISENTDGTHKLTNQAGASFNAEQVDERCAKPFRELSVRWDGNVAICCDDWPGIYKIGNVNEMPLDEIWYHPRFEAARRRLYAAQRDFGPCKGCNVRTLRNGLLPDKHGKGEMLPADDESNNYIKQALRGKIFTIKLGKT